MICCYCFLAFSANNSQSSLLLLLKLGIEGIQRTGSYPRRGVFTGVLAPRPAAYVAVSVLRRHHTYMSFNKGKRLWGILMLASLHLCL